MDYREIKDLTDLAEVNKLLSDKDIRWYYINSYTTTDEKNNQVMHYCLGRHETQEESQYFWNNIFGKEDSSQDTNN